MTRGPSPRKIRTVQAGYARGFLAKAAAEVQVYHGMTAIVTSANSVAVLPAVS